MERRIKLAAISMLAVLVAAVGVNAGYAQSRRGTRRVAPSQPTAPTDRLKAPTPAPLRKVVGTCNTVKGCAVLKDACLAAKGTFKSTGGGSGACFDGSENGRDDPSADVGLATPENVREATLYCFSVALCRKVKNFCAVVGGTYTPTSGHSGTCEH